MDQTLTDIWSLLSGGGASVGAATINNGTSAYPTYPNQAGIGTGNVGAQAPLTSTAPASIGMPATSTAAPSIGGDPNSTLNQQSLVNPSTQIGPWDLQGPANARAKY